VNTVVTKERATIGPRRTLDFYLTYLHSLRALNDLNQLKTEEPRRARMHRAQLKCVKIEDEEKQRMKTCA
jgi:hypothetical protein